MIYRRLLPALPVMCVGLACLAGGCSRQSGVATGLSRSGPTSPGREETTAPTADEQAFLPDPARTPGDTFDVTVDDICKPGYSHAVRNVPESSKRDVYAAYGIAHHEPGEYEVDHLISLELGGSNSEKNLWPQSYRTQPWNAHVKDRLEDELHREVCSGQMDMKTAQREISGNWIAAYRRIFHTDTPEASGGRRRGEGAPESEPAGTGSRSGSVSSESEGSGSKELESKGANTRVWVNTRSGKYFLPGARYYGNTREGEYMSESDAVRQGYRAAGGGEQSSGQ